MRMRRHALLLAIVVVVTCGVCIASAAQVVCRSQITDEFEGWDGDTIFELDNGTIWRQAEYHYEYHYAYRPEVIIFTDGGYFYALVEDMDDAIRVDRLR